MIMWGFTVFQTKLIYDYWRWDSPFLDNVSRPFLLLSIKASAFLSKIYLYILCSEELNMMKLNEAAVKISWCKASQASLGSRKVRRKAATIHPIWSFQIKTNINHPHLFQDPSQFCSKTDSALGLSIIPFVAAHFLYCGDLLSTMWR